jgi:hypothetical protein
MRKTKNWMLFLIIFSCSCRGQVKNVNDNEINKAKWYFYCYAVDLDAVYNKTRVNPLSCDVMLGKYKAIDKDTTKIYFETFYKDTTNACNFYPLPLVGIMVIKKKYFLPVYHTISFDNMSEDSILRDMRSQEAKLKKSIAGRGQLINSWLIGEAKARNIVK